MSRRRYISTEISTDSKVAELTEGGTLPLLLYTWAIPHMDDWGRMIGDAKQFKLTVCPGLDISTLEVEEALCRITNAGLWKRYQVGGKWYISINEESWYRYQTYIPKGKREDCRSLIPSPKNTEEHRISPQNIKKQQKEAFCVPSPSPSPSPSNTLGEVLKTETLPTSGQPKKIEVVKNPNIKVFIDYAYQTFKDKYGIALCIDGGKDGNIVQKLLEIYPIETLMALWDEYMRRYEGEDDDFLKRAGISIGVFKSQINKLILRPPPTKVQGVAGAVRNILEKRVAGGRYDGK